MRSSTGRATERCVCWPATTSATLCCSSAAGPVRHLRERALEVLIDLLPRLWKPAGPPFTSLADEAAWWVSTIRGEWEKAGKPFEEALVEAAISIARGAGRDAG